MMWGNDGNTAFRRGGCWAACHDDMDGMRQDKGQGLSKYLWVARSQQKAIGRPGQSKPAAELNELRERGNFVEIWKADINSTKDATIAGGTVRSRAGPPSARASGPPRSGARCRVVPATRRASCRIPSTPLASRCGGLTASRVSIGSACRLPSA